MAQQTTLKEFESVFPRLEQDLVDWAKQYKLPQEQLDWYTKVGQHRPRGTRDSCRGRLQIHKYTERETLG